MAIINFKKADTLAATFFPPPPETPSISPTAYTEPLKPHGIFSWKYIPCTIQNLSPYKALGIGSIQGIILQNCVDSIIDHLYYLFCTILELDTHPSHSLIILTIILHKPGKAACNVTKAYHPIGLLETIGKFFSTLVAKDLFFITKKHNLLPPTQFGGRPGCCTTKTMHLVVTKIKDAQRSGRVVFALFLNIQATLNTVKSFLLHNMKSWCVPTQYIWLFKKMLSNPQT